MRKCILAAASLAFLASNTHAQPGFRERTLGAPTAIDSEPFRNIASVRELSDGRLIVAERGAPSAMLQGVMSDMMRRLAPGGRGGRGAAVDSTAPVSPPSPPAPAAPGRPRREARVLVFDRALAHAAPVGRASAESGDYAQPEMLLAGVADTTLLIDIGESDIAVIDPSGAIVHPKANPAVQGAMLAINGVAVDRGGRLLYVPRVQVTRTTPAGMVFGSPDSAAITAYDFKTGGTIPVAEVRVAPNASTVARDTTQRGGTHMAMKSFPFPTIDDWVMMSDGTLAIIRGADLHVDWIAPGGKKRSTPPIPYVKVAVTDSDKVKFLTTMHRTEGAMPAMPMAMSVTVSEPDSFPQFKPPFSARGARAASDGTIWIPSSVITPGTKNSYDVIGPNGRVRERIHLMKDQRLLGFGKGVIYVAVNQGPQDNRVARVPLR